MKKYIIIKADTNDGDYITNQSIITDEKIEQLKTALSKIKDSNYSLSWGTGDMLEEDNDPNILYPELTPAEFNLIENYIPHGEYGIHTIESIDILEVINEEKLL